MALFTLTLFCARGDKLLISPKEKMQPLAASCARGETSLTFVRDKLLISPKEKMQPSAASCARGETSLTFVRDKLLISPKEKMQPLAASCARGETSLTFVRDKLLISPKEKMQPLAASCARGETRTPKDLTPTASETATFTNFATRAGLLRRGGLAKIMRFDEISEIFNDTI